MATKASLNIVILGQVPMWTVGLPAMDFDPGTPLPHSPVNACSDTGFGLVDTLALCNCVRFRSFIPSLSLWPTIRHPFGSTQFVAALRAKFCSGLLVRLWPGWIGQLAHISFRGAPTTKLQPKDGISTNMCETYHSLSAEIGDTCEIKKI